MLSPSLGSFRRALKPIFTQLRVNCCMLVNTCERAPPIRFNIRFVRALIDFARDKCTYYKYNNNNNYYYTKLLMHNYITIIYHVCLLSYYKLRY
jgi:hypothetical protein